MLVGDHPEARAELRAAALWYQQQRDGLDNEFLSDFRETLLRISQNPELPRFFVFHFRRVKFKRFPYAVVYEITGKSIFIIAIMHLHRRPLYWLQRAKPV